MPKKIRELKAMLRKAGFFQRSGKGSLTVWEHPKLQDKLTLSGRDGDDASLVGKHTVPAPKVLVSQ